MQVQCAEHGPLFHRAARPAAMAGIRSVLADNKPLRLVRATFRNHAAFRVGVPEVKMKDNASARQQLYTERQKNGLIVIPCVCVELDVIDVLQSQGFLDTYEPTRRELSDALSKFVYRAMTRHYT